MLFYKMALKHFVNMIEKKQDKYYPIIPKKYTDYCEDNEDALPLGIFYDTVTYQYLTYVRYPRLQSPIQFMRELDSTDAKESLTHEKKTIRSNSITEKMHRELPKDFGIWFEQQNAFLQSLPIADKFALVAMTNQSHNHVQEYLAKGTIHILYKRMASWSKHRKLRGYLPIFFPLRDILLTGQFTFESSIQKRWETQKTVRKQYLFLLHHLDKIPYAIALTATKHLIEQIMNIFKRSPPLRTRIVVYRGLKNQFSQDPTRFLSTSLDPQHALRYAANQCCMQRILIPRGVRLLFVAGFSSYKKEQEFLLHPGRLIVTRQYDIFIPEMKKNKHCPVSTRRMDFMETVYIS